MKQEARMTAVRLLKQLTQGEKCFLLKADTHASMWRQDDLPLSTMWVWRWNSGHQAWYLYPLSPAQLLLFCRLLAFFKENYLQEKYPLSEMLVTKNCLSRQYRIWIFWLGVVSLYFHIDSSEYNKIHVPRTQSAHLLEGRSQIPGFSRSSSCLLRQSLPLGLWTHRLG